MSASNDRSTASRRAPAPFKGGKLAGMTAWYIGVPLLVLFFTNWIVTLGVVVLFGFFGRAQYKLLGKSLKASRDRAQAAIGYESSDEDPDTDEDNREDEPAKETTKEDDKLAATAKLHREHQNTVAGQIADTLRLFGLPRDAFREAWTNRDYDPGNLRRVIGENLSDHQRQALSEVHLHLMDQCGIPLYQSSPQAAPVINTNAQPADTDTLNDTLPAGVLRLPTVDNVNTPQTIERPFTPFSALPDTRSVQVHRPQDDTGTSGSPS